MKSMILQRSVRRVGFIFVVLMVMAGILLPTAVSAAPAEKPAYGFYYTVQPGDTLSQIARWNGTTVNAIMTANGLYSTRIYVGQVLYIPSGGGGGGGGGGGWCSQVYVVQPGDTLSQIARWFGVSMSAIARANGIVNYSHIYVGQRLCIPSGHPGPGPGPVPPPHYCSQYYTVRPGDNLSRIAQWCGTTVRNLMYLNGIHNPNFIYVGQVIRTY